MVKLYQIFRKVKMQYNYQLEICQNYILCHLFKIFKQEVLLILVKKIVYKIAYKLGLEVYLI